MRKKYLRKGMKVATRDRTTGRIKEMLKHGVELTSGKFYKYGQISNAFFSDCFK